jgi:hypothetical protein
MGIKNPLGDENSHRSYQPRWQIWLIGSVRKFR